MLKKFTFKNTKHKKLKIFLLIIVIIIITIISKNLIINTITYHNDKKIINKIQEIKKEKITYVFITINPELMLTLKNNLVNDISCLNDDCLKVTSDLNIIGDNLEDSVEKIYNVVKEKGFKVDNGVNIKYKKGEDIQIKLDYVTTEEIDNNMEKDLLNKIIDDEYQDTSSDYNNSLWYELKQDKDYGKYYECNIISDELECHIKNDILLGFVVESSDFKGYLTKFAGVFNNLGAIERIFHKFGIETKAQVELGFFKDPIRKIYINNREYEVLSSENQISQNTLFETFKGCDYAKFKLTDLDLLHPSLIESKLFYEEGAFEEQYSIDTIDCGIKYCKKSVSTYINSCDEATKKVELNVDSYTNYYICDSNKNNCQEVDKEVYDKIDMNYGLMED